ncbi:transmembrane amino acid transporter protein-domain-containing protein [Radiomyces spectabilis]|uniref:transmembrane amino acid transporter protein-domain-containing protein n=1 Tax=Radiomyces spectabilis TaxID=64574 RepID=UPI002220E66E|nr:transmembrane amino acid transporter protein-domain-containing protein [Radiomyces spectabilis]KAI8388713.1 transmembrane amino acid transporter protein-domain-containing protein [Radiomyces spectabilis]
MQSDMTVHENDCCNVLDSSVTISPSVKTLPKVTHEEHKDIAVPERKLRIWQSCTNTMNILLGLGLLSIPYAFRVSGWLIGWSFFLLWAILSNYTGNRLVQCFNEDITSYVHLCTVLWGKKGRIVMGIIFIFEAFGNGVANALICADNVHELFPEFDIIHIKLVSMPIVTCISMLPMRYLGYTSCIGAISSLGLIIVSCIDGLTKRHAPGSLLEPMQTSLWPTNWKLLPYGLGIMCYVFAGHIVFPSIYKKMKTPHLYSRVLLASFTLTTILHGFMGSTMYLMFGDNTEKEITQNILRQSDYSIVLNKLVVWTIVLTVVSKYALCLQITYEMEARGLAQARFLRKFPLLGVLRYIIYVLTSIAAVAIAILFPDFDRILSFFGSALGTVTCIIIPLLCYLKMFWSSISAFQRTLNIGLIVITAIIAMVGTVWSFIPGDLLQQDSAPR